jgi:hypothetical protein
VLVIAPQLPSILSKSEISFIFAGVVRSRSSSILKLMTGRLTAAFVIGLLAGSGGALPLVADETNTAKAPDTFFAGTVTELTSESVTVGRTVRGKAESRTFALTSQTKTEGKLVAKVRVTVRYVADDDGYTATLIVVRGSAAKAAKQKK